MKIEIVDHEFLPWQELAAYERQQPSQLSTGAGATAVFVGTMRDYNEDNEVKSMVLEHYPAMTRSYLEQMVEEAIAEFRLLDVLLIHRVGQIFPGQSIVLVAVWSAHRAAAFTACREIMEKLKAKAPLWKKEMAASGERWVEHNTPG